MGTVPKFKFPQTVFSECRRLRYTLSRYDLPGTSWSFCREGFVQFVCLNPSTADEAKNDQTVLTCMGLAANWLFERLVITNIFPFRSTDATELYKVYGPKGEGRLPERDDNLPWLLSVADQAEVIIAAWGNHGAHLGRGKVIAEHLHRYFPGKLNVLQSAKGRLLINKGGHPRHPLYLPHATKFAPWIPGEMAE